jgi:serine/threonine protein kinase
VGQSGVMVEQKSDGAGNASDADIVALRPGTRIGRHEVLAVLGQGGFGITYRASDSQLHRDVAIKEYLPTLLAYRSGGTTVMPRSTKVAEDFAWGRDRFVAEGRTLASLHHAPGIVRVFDFLETNGTAYIVMEMLRGDTLEARIKSGPPLDGAAVERILHTLLDGLEQVHDAGFLHRDIKPANILLDAKGNPTLIDFGASRAAMTGRTVAMTAIFTPGYAATEQMTSAKQGPWTDIYGLAATLYHAITGRPPPNAFDRMLDDEYEPLARLAPQGFPPGLIAGIDAGLAVRASDRPQSIAGWRALLSMSAAGATDATQLSSSRTIDPDATMLARTPTVLPVSSSPSSTLSSTMQPAPSAPPPSAQPPKSRAPLYAGVAAAVLLLAGGGYLGLSPSEPKKPTAAPPTVALQDLKVEDLERALAERRAADAAAAEKRRLEEEAQRKVEADAAAKQAADAELVKAEAARKAAEEELARLKTEIEVRRQEAQNEARRAEAEAAQRKAEAEMAALRQAEEDARRKATAEAETKRLADEALVKAQAERLRTEEEAQKKAAAEKKEKADASAKQIAEAEAQEKAKAAEQAKAEADAKAKADAEAAAKKTAEAAEAGLRLGVPERQKVQVALSSLGFDTRGNDGALGPRSREMIAAWQKARNRPTTGFLDGAQHEALTREAAPALQKYDADQKKKAEDEKKAAEEAAKAKAATPTPAPTPAAPTPSASTTTAAATAPPSGEARWTGNFKCDLWSGTGIPITLAPVNGKVSQSFPGRGGTVVTINMSGNQVSGTVNWRAQSGDKTLSGSFSATISGNSVTTTTMSRADFKGGIGPTESLCTLTLSKAG